MIKLQIIGYVGKNAVENDVNGKAVLNFTVAHNERYKNAQGMQKDRTVWADCAMWAPNAIGPYLLQGTLVYVEGTPYIDLYKASDGTPAAALKVRVTQVKLLPGGPKAADEKNAAAETPAPVEPTEELPF